MGVLISPSGFLFIRIFTILHLNTTTAYAMHTIIDIAVLVMSIVTHRGTLLHNIWTVSVMVIWTSHCNQHVPEESTYHAVGEDLVPYKIRTEIVKFVLLCKMWGKHEWMNHTIHRWIYQSLKITLFKTLSLNMKQGLSSDLAFQQISFLNFYVIVIKINYVNFLHLIENNKQINMFECQRRVVVAINGRQDGCQTCK